MIMIRNLTKKYGSNLVLNIAELDIEKGHIYGFIGPNGAGKTTLFKILAGLTIPTTGEMIVTTGENIKKYRQKMSFMIENPYLYESMTALENIKIIGGIRGETNDNLLIGLLHLLKIDNTGKKKVKHFSLGMRQRLGIACALAADPEVIVLDEPMNGVDPEGIVELRELLTNLCKERDITMLISSHILGELFQLCTDFVFIHNGQIVNKLDKKTVKDTDLDLESFYMKEIVGNENS